MKLFVLIVVFGLSAFASGQEEAETPAADEWYKAEYAPLFGDQPWEKLDALSAFYAETLHNHDDDSIVNSRDWISEALQQWKIEGWIRSELAELDYDQLNLTTASFKAKWRDYYTGGNIAYECAWYLADFADSKWQFSDYATIICSEHSL